MTACAAPRGWPEDLSARLRNRRIGGRHPREDLLPGFDPIACRGGIRHALLSFRLRSRRVANDLFFALIPPHWHHSREELVQLRAIPVSRWFQYGYCAWRFTASGERAKELPPDVDKRWDPRCADPRA